MSSECLFRRQFEFGNMLFASPQTNHKCHLMSQCLCKCVCVCGAVPEPNVVVFDRVGNSNAFYMVPSSLFIRFASFALAQFSKNGRERQREREREKGSL